MGVNFGADDSSAYSLMGYLGGFTSKVKTSAYIGAVLDYTHARLAQFFNEYFDKVAQGNPEEYQHVYEWPTEYHAYRETVGQRHARLWKHTFTGNGKGATASFVLLPSKRPSPVDPILLEEGPGGRAVKQNVHIFVWKAEAFEYGIPITVEPTLAKMLAYVGRDTTSGGYDEGWHHANEHESRNSVNLSSGPVHFTAGGGKTTLKFTSAFILYWQTLAGDDFTNRIAPTLQERLISEAEFDKAIRIGKSKRNKAVSITAQATQNEAAFEEARASAIADMATREVQYIRDAAAIRRMEQYGE